MPEDTAPEVLGCLFLFLLCAAFVVAWLRIAEAWETTWRAWWAKRRAQRHLDLLAGTDWRRHGASRWRVH